MNNMWYPYNFGNYYPTGVYPNPRPPMIPTMEVKPINVNVNINGSRDFTITQKSQTYHHAYGSVIIPEINMKVTFDKSDNRGRPIRRQNGFQHRQNGRYTSRKYPTGKYQPTRTLKRPKRSKSNKYDDLKDSGFKTFDSKMFPGAKVIELDMKDLKNGSNPIEAIFNKLLGVSDEKEDVVLEAPLQNELNFDMEKEYDELPFEVKTLDDLISLADLYDKENEHMFGFNMKRLHNIKDSMIRLNNIIGMTSVKETICHKLITYLQGLGDMDDMNHIVIQAPPGYGKTMLGFHLSEIFYKLGLIKVPKDKKDNSKKYTHPFTGETIDFPFVVAKRKDLIGQYVGHTAPKVEKVVEEALGGVLFIDEAYSLGSSSKESFSTEAINTLNQLLSEKAGQFICMIAGYKDHLQKSFFINPGLQRRFRMVFEIQKYSDNELAKIFEMMVSRKKWSLDEELIDNDMDKLTKFIKDNRMFFKYCGGDIESFLQNVRDAHSLRVFGKHPKMKKIITFDDILEGFKMFEKSTDREDDRMFERLKHSLYC